MSYLKNTRILCKRFPQIRLQPELSCGNGYTVETGPVHAVRVVPFFFSLFFFLYLPYNTDPQQPE